MSPARDPLAAAVEALLRRFRTQRPLRGGSLLITLFGDSIAPRGGAVTLGSLIALAQPFGLSERLVRTSVARLAAEGWLEATRHGRHSEYRLTGGGEKRFAEATRRIYGLAPAAWEGQWTMVVLPPSADPARRNRRQELRWLGFGQLGPGVFAHPTCTIEEARAWLATLGDSGDGWILKSTTEGEAADRKLAAAGWSLSELARRYRRFRDTFAPVRAAIAQRQIAPQPAFVVRTLLIHEYRKVHLQDPLLPSTLLPPNWIGAEAYALCKTLYAGVFAAADGFLSDTARRIHEPLPPPEPATYRRFGGITASAAQSA